MFGEVLRHALVGVLTAAGISALAYLASRTRPKDLAAGTGRIGPHRTIVLSAMIVGLALAAFMAYGAMTSAHALLPALFAIFFLALSLGCATALTPVYDIVWNETGLEGPIPTLLPHFGPVSRAVRA